MARPASSSNFSAARSAGPWFWAAGGAGIGLLAAVIVFAPAQWLAGALQRASAGQVLLNEPRGTVWSGSAQLALTGGAGSIDRAALPSRLEWRLRPAWGGLRATLASACCTPAPVRLDLRPRWGGALLTIEDAQAQGPAALLAGLGTPWNTLQIEGDLQLATQGLSVEWISGRTVVAGRAELTAQGVSSRLSTLRPIGSYRIILAGGAAPTLQLVTLEGSLRLSGSGQWIGSKLRFSGEASAAPEREAALSNLLNIIGRRNGARTLITIG